MQVVFLKSFTKKSNLALSQLIGVSSKTVVTIERRNKPLKNLFEEYRMQQGNAYGEYLIQSAGLLFDGMNDILTEAMSKKRIFNG